MCINIAGIKLACTVWLFGKKIKNISSASQSSTQPEMWSIDHFTVVCFSYLPLNESEAGVDLALIEISQLFLCKFLLMGMTTKSLNIRKAVRFLSKQGQLQPHFHLKAR